MTHKNNELDFMKIKNIYTCTRNIVRTVIAQQ